MAILEGREPRGPEGVSASEHGQLSLLLSCSCSTGHIRSLSLTTVLTSGEVATPPSVESPLDLRAPVLSFLSHFLSFITRA